MGHQKNKDEPSEMKVNHQGDEVNCAPHSGQGF